jgi:transcriptional regulator with XRE-family HTH domain
VVALTGARSDPDRSAVLSKATVRSAERLGLTGQALSQVLGLSEATISRLRRGELALQEGSKPFELAALLVRVFRSLDAIAGGDERTMRAWIANHNSALGAAPSELIRTITGLTDVVAYLDARRAVL